MKRRILFLGCGYATRLHSRVLSRRGDVELFYASRDGVRAEACRREFGGAGAFASYERGVTHDVDLVVVATPPSLHLEHAMLAMDAGRHVVIEKPAFVHASDADDVGAVAAERGLMAFVAENYAYKPIVAHLRGLIERGDLGDVRFVTINATKRQHTSGWRADPAFGGGDPVFEGGIHWVSFAASLGLEISAATRYRSGPESSLLVLEYDGGAVGTIAHSWELAAPLGGLRLSKIQGTRGAATFESNGFALAVSGPRPSVGLLGLADPTGARAMWADFLAVLDSGEEPRYTLAMAQRDLRLIEDSGCRADVRDIATRCALSAATRSM